MSNKVGKRILRLTPLEDSFSLVTMLQINLQGRSIGAYLLRKGVDNFLIQFGFECTGIHSTLRSEQIDPVFDAIESGLKDLPSSERLTIHLSSFTNDTSRQQQLKNLSDIAPTKELQYLLMGERCRTQQLTIQGVRKPKKLHLYCTYTVETNSTGTSDALEKALSKLERSWKSFTGEINELQFIAIERLIHASFTDGFQLWEQLISNKMGLDIRPINADKLWSELWQRFNNTPPRPIPQLLILDENGLREEIYSDVAPTSFLMESESSIPIADRRWVHLKEKYIAALTFVNKPGGWVDKERQMHYLWEVLSRERVYDTEIYCQLMRASETLVKTNMQRLTKQANTSAALAQNKNSVDVKSLLNIKKSVAAQEELYEGAVPIHVATVFLVYRKTREQLDEACRYLQSCFLSPAWVIRETEYPWRIWLQTLPIVWERLMTAPFNRRLVYLSGEVPGLMPLVRTKAWDSSGFELIAEEGGTPVFLDLYNQHKNLGLFATTRAGKSVLASGILTQALAHGMPVVAIDYPKPDGTSTFTDYTRFMGKDGAYFDIGKESSNLFELPNLRSLPTKLQQERFEDYKDFLATALLAMVVGNHGSASSQVLTNTVRSIIALALKAFFGDELIRDRYAAAYTNGFGSDEWSAMPTLHDFLSFCSHERLRLDSLSGDTKAALETIRLRLRFWLSSRVGQALAQPSTFRSDAHLLIFALRNLSNDQDAAILSLSAYSAALRRALASPASIFFIDESPILFEFDAIAALVGRLCANGAKAGIRVILSAQDPDTIAKSPSGSKIFQNLTTRLIGRIQPTAVDSFSSILKYPQEIISRNATESFFPKKEGFYSQWLLDDNGIFTFCRYYPAFNLLAVVANNPSEQEQRTQALSKYPDKFVALTELSRQLVKTK
ncbi:MULTISPECIES: hypothetical protein [unclassified Tolypothrix]|uniref:hypothetical protein n=1 Tax=unclassified Tolypothrix TaxID=2649714 RepID=UPI0005EAB13D|nr:MULTISPECIES: hypothetical protein [unclassified Tolypothrix]BAY93643.1 hypothetical protein NIES3275_56850 [Microchaete diplosiphon NIES-3275]EKE99557.1 hypothetical protein FDUTEX481_09817 [Tolypothrix sp. PCC 7601]MBE9081696.1 hypothetical protein [Tolypothrix sp. LEGE 11397]UYD27463.1 hypothetical protein HGR01_05080 [Tolypothrix sp. PCC 7712]UYD36673.1 hypothetical protein HG267_13630 [Tolypothrix sp. PCC 7601]